MSACTYKYIIWSEMTSQKARYTNVHISIYIYIYICIHIYIDICTFIYFIYKDMNIYT
jgi:hypothetical protein